MRLVADRFAPIDGDRAIDLATAGEVVLVCSTGRSPEEQARWTLRCDWFFDLRHPAIAALVDYGRVGEHARFEAWRCGAVWRGGSAPARRVLLAAARFLTACGVTAGSLAGCRHSSSGAPVLLPSPDAGYRLREGARADRELAAEEHGVRLLQRAAVGRLADVIAAGPGSAPAAVALWGPPGSGVRTAMLTLARAGRVHGIVPVAAALSDAGRSLEGRTQLVLALGAAAPGWRRLLQRTLLAPRPHLLVLAGAAESPHLPGVGLEPVPADRLLASIVPPADSGSVMKRFRQAAARADGLPGRFVQSIWGRGALYGRASGRGGAGRAAEQAPVYGVAMPGAALMRPTAGRAPMPAAETHAECDGRLEAARRLARRGRHAAAERALRAAIGFLARRREADGAARGTVALASLLLRRGRPADAQRALASVAEMFDDIEPSLGREAGVLRGVAATDLGLLDEAEAVLGAAVAASRAAGDRSNLIAASLAAARCLFWRGRYAEAEQALALLDGCSPDARLSARLTIARARLAIGRRDAARAVARAAAGLDAAKNIGDAELIAKANCAAAFVHLALGDREAVDREVAACVIAARAARDPLQALKARLIGAECARRHGRNVAGYLPSARANRLSRGRVPPILGIRLALLTDLASPGPPDAVDRRISTSGLAALALYAPQVSDAADLAGAADDLLEVLTCCQTSEDDEAVLVRLCARLRTRLRAAAVGFVAAERGTATVLVSDGGRVDPALAERIIAARQAIAPLAHHDVVQGGAPVRYADAVPGALVARWHVGTRPDPARTVFALTTAAAAAAPALSGVLTRRAAAAREATGLLGVSPAIAEVRGAIARAAPAPFPVLVDGESGSGKELAARELHRLSQRRDRPFCTLNCAALPEDLVEAELFGYARGAFTGAVAERAGVFEEAHTGTLFLDEIGELSPRAQAKILRTLQEGELRRVGENIARRIDVRLVAATNRELQQEVAAGRFRLDLMYRLDVIRITLPPLRARRDDIPVLAERFWRELAVRIGSRATLSGSVLEALSRYDWPGNVRELQNVLAALVVRSPRRGVVPATALPPVFGAARRDGTLRLDAARRTFEEQFVRAALVRCGGHRGRAAEELGLSRQGLAKLLDRLGIDGGGDEDVRAALGGTGADAGASAAPPLDSTACTRSE